MQSLMGKVPEPGDHLLGLLVASWRQRQRRLRQRWRRRPQRQLLGQPGQCLTPQPLAAISNGRARGIGMPRNEIYGTAIGSRVGGT